MQLKTNYTVGEIPHSEHPLPQAKRENWLCLNGKWNLQKLNKEGEKIFDGEILVPFSPETLNSGIEEGFVLHAGESLRYERTVFVDGRLLKGITLLHFGAVDSECEVFLNDEKVGEHRGGYTAFTIDVSKQIRLGENKIVVLCRDEGTRNGGAKGKQADKAGGIWYTAQSGIWQTVWLESMPSQRIGNFKITPNAMKKTVKISNLGDIPTKITIYDGGKEILFVEAQGEAVLAYDFMLWSPENPKLYDVVMENEFGDRVETYFGIRSFGMGKDEKGKARLFLNGKPYFFNGLLDQGYWSDGLLTYPSDEAVQDELKLMKDMGFNTLRKHIKIEPMRWYYHCDRLGLIVWQDFVNGGGEYNFLHIAAFPFLGFRHKDSDYKYFARENEEGRAEFLTSIDETIEQLYNCTCIGVWVPFNEGWGQFDSAKVVEMMKEKDDTRIIDSVSGWHDQGKDKTTLKSLHIYYTKLKVPKDSRPVVLSEFGGYSMKTEGHVFAEDKEFGYKKFKSKEALLAALKTLYLKKLLLLIKKGLCGCIYTQVSDVEEEINGLVTYDRKVVKVDVEEMLAINTAIKEETEKIC